ncbi:MAG: hypothetical protein IJT58_06340 [Synergistaceae bacterium]|nr:hypothetical protein [Synergistaceae bacterium]
MNQDFINWLNSADDVNSNSNTLRDNDLLVAPLVVADPQDIRQGAPKEIGPDLDSDPESDSQLQPDSESELQPEAASELQPEAASELQPEAASQPEPESEISNILQELRNLRKQVENLDGNIPAQYDEPPPETWAEYDTEIDENSELYEHYEQGIDFQEYNDKIPHGTNFTRRLQRILHERKERAAEEKSRADSQKAPHPYMIKGILFCLALIIALLFAWGVLFVLQKKVPNYTQHTSTLSLNEQEQEHKQVTRATEHEPAVIKAGDDVHTETESESKPHEVNIAKTVQTTQPAKPPVPLTFEDYLREGNEAFNLGIYNSALKNFFRALELDGNDTRPYIGLAGAYRAKGLYFDSKRILDEAMMIFRKNPTIETALKILEGESKHGSSKRNNRQRCSEGTRKTRL